tara:strand:+ start:1172 stop:1789 length:618 start_codon:yes stop_codon:yes gene_type:complete
MVKTLQYDYFETGNDPEKVIVAIHGWKGDKTSMYPIMKLMKIENANWFLLDAPYIVENGKGKSWSYQHKNGAWEVDKPKELLNNFFKQLFNQYDSKKIYVLGFSQGGMICLDFVLYLDKVLGGVFPICGFLRQPKLDVQRYHPCQIDTPILIGHGKDDDIVPSESSQLAHELLNKQGANVELLLYNGKHKIGLDYVKKMVNIINK